MPNIDVSIVIVNWNTKVSLRDCLESVYKHTHNIQYETIVIDNASSDGSIEMVKENYPQVVLIENSENRGFAAANNQGINIAKGRYILLLNSDTVVYQDTIYKTVEYADQKSHAAVVGCQVWEDSNTIQMTCFRFPDPVNILFSAIGLSRIFRNNKILGREQMLWWKRNTEKEVDVVSGMFMFVRRKAIEQIGLMDEAFFMYCEEGDWCYRFKKAGWKILFWPGTKIMHVHGGSHSSDQVAEKMYAQKQKSLLLFIKKHSGILSCLLSRFILIFSFGLRICVWTILLVFSKLAGKQPNNNFEQIRKNWAAFKFCALAI